MTIVTKNKAKRQQPFNEERLLSFIDNVMVDFPDIVEKEKKDFKNKIVRSITRLNEIRAAEINNKLILNSLDGVSRETPNWKFVASRFLLNKMYKESSYNRSYNSSEKYGSLIGLLKYLGEKGIYSEHILKEYTEEEINQAQQMIDPDKDKLFDYAGLKTLADRYLAKDYDGRTFELPQERWMIIALHVMSIEPKEHRMERVKEFYWALSNLYMTVATPSMANAGKTTGQLSSCFIDTVGDSLRDIYDSNTDVALNSKFGGGIGIYMGKVRAKGSDIRGFKGVSTGVINWMKQLNNTGVSVDQLGTRQGSIAVTLDVWHKDFPLFAEARLNNGDERMRTHDLFLSASIPDLFMEQVQKRGEWYLFDPHEVRTVMGWSLEDFYDEKKGSGSFRDKYEECVQNNNLSKTRVKAIDIMKSIMKAQLETGAMFMFFRDEVNRMNPNKDKGMIYSSNLCHEIAQNMQETTHFEDRAMEIDGETYIASLRKPGKYVVCNLSSIHLGRAVPANVLERLILIQVRALDNVIDINQLPVIQSQLTNADYRPIGLGTFSLHHLMALNAIQWGSEKGIKYNDYLYEKINYLTIKASMDLAKEKSPYPLFKGSDWDTGEYFDIRDYGTGKYDDTERFIKNEDWLQLKEDVHTYGIRNGYLFAVAPNGSTSVIANGTATTDPIFRQFYHEEKKDYKLPVVVPDLSPATSFFYEGAYTLDQHGSIEQASKRQRHIDQSQSFNLYVSNSIKASELLSLVEHAWESGMKTIYYTRSTSIDVTECESCQ